MIALGAVVFCNTPIMTPPALLKRGDTEGGRRELESFQIAVTIQLYIAVGLGAAGVAMACWGGVKLQRQAMKAETGG